MLEMLSLTHREGTLKNFKLESGLIRFAVFWMNYSKSRGKNIGISTVYKGGFKNAHVLMHF